MTTQKNNPIAQILRGVGSTDCLKKAAELNQEISQLRSINFRGLSLSSPDVLAISACLSQAKKLQSISFSYNKNLGDSGAIALANKLPYTLMELGLVDCGIKDIGGKRLLNWLNKATDLTMICIEQNHFSELLKEQFRSFSKQHPNILVVV